jgi:hypothetical protein
MGVIYHWTFFFFLYNVQSSLLPETIKGSLGVLTDLANPWSLNHFKDEDHEARIG